MGRAYRLDQAKIKAGLGVAWIFGIGIGLFLLFAFPRQFGALLGVCALIAGGIFLYFWSDTKSAERQRKQIDISASFNVARCNQDYPILVIITNRSRKQVDRVTFSLYGYRPGHSEPVSRNYSLYSDRILAPGMAYSACWQYGRATRSANVIYSTLRWEAKVTGVTPR